MIYAAVISTMGPTMYDILTCGGGLRAQKAHNGKINGDLHHNKVINKNDADVRCG